MMVKFDDLVVYMGRTWKVLRVNGSGRYSLATLIDGKTVVKHNVSSAHVTDVLVEDEEIPEEKYQGTCPNCGVDIYDLVEPERCPNCGLSAEGIRKEESEDEE